MVLHISSADLNDEWLSRGADFENRQPQKRSESLNLISFIFRKCFIHFVLVYGTRGNFKVKLLSTTSSFKLSETRNDKNALSLS